LLAVLREGFEAEVCGFVRHLLAPFQ
jgi:hypothetical protein